MIPRHERTPSPRRGRLFRAPHSWGWFIGVLVLTVRELASGHYLGLATGAPFLIASVLAREPAQRPLWIAFTLGATANVAVALIGHPHYVVAGIYLLLLLYGADETRKTRGPRRRNATPPT